MRFVNKERLAEIDFLRDLIVEQREEIKQLRAQIDEARDIPPYVFGTGKTKPAKIHVLNDSNMARIQRGEKLDEE